jgi:AcrR family transcriptional regulator
MSLPDPHDGSARPPSQARSRATLDRLLDATAALLAEKSFDQASVAEIVRRAGSSVGAFYGRFPDKDALLDRFDARFFDVARASCDEFFNSTEWLKASLDASVAQLISLLVCNHRRHSGVLKALAVRARTQSESRFRERAARHNRYVLEALKHHLLSRSERILHPAPARAIELAFLFVASAIRAVVLFDDVAGLAKPDDCELARELTCFFLAYLQTQEPHLEPLAPLIASRRGREPGPARAAAARKRHKGSTASPRSRKS